MRPDGTPDFRLHIPARITLAAEVDPEAGADAEGRVRCVASIFDQRVPRMFYDMQLMSGCFDESLSERGLPSFVWSHDWQTPPIGTTERCEQVDLNLEGEATLFPPDTDLLRHLRLAMSEHNADGRVPLREFSIGFDVLDADWIERDGDEVLGISRGLLYEFGPCLVGAVAGTGFLQAPDADELLSRFPRPNQAQKTEPEGRLERAHARSLRA